MSAVDLEREPRRGSIRRRILVLTFANLFAPLSAIVTLPLMAHGLGVNGRGEVAAVTAPYLLALAVAAFGLPEATTYFIASGRSARKSVLARGLEWAVVSSALAAAAVYASAPFLSGGDDRLEKLIEYSALLLPFSLVIGILRGMAGGQARFGLVAAERGLAALTRLIGIVGLSVASALTVQSCALVIVMSPVVGALPYILLLRGGAQTSEGAPATAVGRWEVGAYGGRVWIGAISGVLLSRLDQTLMTALSSPEQLGYYAVAVSLGELPLILNIAVRDVMFTADAASRDDRLLTQAARLSSTACAVAALAIGLVLPFVDHWVLGPGFGPAVPVAWLMLIAVAVGTPGSIAGAGLSGRGRPGLRSISLVIACIVNAALVIALVPSLGAIGAALATVVGNLIASNLNIVWLHRHFGVRWLDFYVPRRSDLQACRDVVGKWRRSTNGAVGASRVEEGEVA